MEVIEIQHLRGMNYPIGKNFNSNLFEIRILAGEFNKIFGGNGNPVNIICTGSSGVIVATVMAMSIDSKVRIIYVPKTGESTHDREQLIVKPGITIIVDDHIASGTSLRRMYGKISDINPHVQIHGLFVSGELQPEKIPFKTDFLVCGYYNIDKRGLERGKYGIIVKNKQPANYDITKSFLDLNRDNITNLDILQMAGRGRIDFKGIDIIMPNSFGKTEAAPKASKITKTKKDGTTDKIL